MASKYWFVGSLKEKSVEENIVSDELQPLYKFLRLKQSRSSSYYAAAATKTPSLSSQPFTEDLKMLEAYEDFEIKWETNRRFFSCSIETKYVIYSGSGKEGLLIGLHKSPICNCFVEANAKVRLSDMNNKHVMQIDQLELTGYISKKLSFSISSSKSKLGEISIILGFLEKPKYEVTDVHGDHLFSVTLSSHQTEFPNPLHHIVGKTGKIGYMNLISDGKCKLQLYQLCTITEKALLLCLLITMDIVKRIKF